MRQLTLLGALCGLLLCLQFGESKIYDKCSLAREMLRLGITRDDLAQWACIAQHESSYNSRAINTNKNSSKNWGLFQINDRKWCDPKDGRKSKNQCKISCNELLGDDISKSLQCALRIKKDPKGFKSWVVWKKRCQGKVLSVGECF